MAGGVSGAVVAFDVGSGARTGSLIFGAGAFEADNGTSSDTSESGTLLTMRSRLCMIGN